MKNRRKIGAVSLVLITLMLIPSTISYAQNQDYKRVEQFIEVARKAKLKTEILINLTLSNTTALNDIDSAGLTLDLEGNVSLFNRGAENVTNAEHELYVEENPEGAVANITEALSIFKEVYKGINRILTESGVQKGQLVDAQGLFKVMSRYRDQIERLREITDDSEILGMLDLAETYLNLDVALIWLQERKVNATAHNVTQAKKMISIVYSSLKKEAEELNIKRIENYLKKINKLYDRLVKKVDLLIKKEITVPVEITDDLEEANQLITEAEPILPNASESIEKLGQARELLSGVENELKTLKEQS